MQNSAITSTNSPHALGEDLAIWQRTQSPSSKNTQSNISKMRHHLVLCWDLERSISVNWRANYLEVEKSGLKSVSTREYKV